MEEGKAALMLAAWQNLQASAPQDAPTRGVKTPAHVIARLRKHKDSVSEFLAKCVLPVRGVCIWLARCRSEGGLAH